MKAFWIACFLLLPLLLSQAQGSSRKLTSMTAPTSSSSTSKNEKINNGGNVRNSMVDGKGASSRRTGGKGEEKEESFRIKTGEQKGDHEPYPDVLDIAGMDYSPAKRKTPIHN